MQSGGVWVLPAHQNYPADAKEHLAAAGDGVSALVFGGQRMWRENPKSKLDLIREGKVAQMYSAIQTGSSFGMQTLDQNLQELVKRNIVSVDEARSKAANKDNFK